MTIGSFAFAARVGHDRGVSTGPVVVQVWIEVCRVELLQRFGMFAGDRAIADLFAHHRPVLALYQSVVGGTVSARFGELFH